MWLCWWSKCDRPYLFSRNCSHGIPKFGFCNLVCRGGPIRITIGILLQQSSHQRGTNVIIIFIVVVCCSMFRIGWFPKSQFWPTTTFFVVLFIRFLTVSCNTCAGGYQKYQGSCSSHQHTTFTAAAAAAAADFILASSNDDSVHRKICIVDWWIEKGGIESAFLCVMMTDDSRALLWWGRKKGVDEGEGLSVCVFVLLIGFKNQNGLLSFSRRQKSRNVNTFYSGVRTTIVFFSGPLRHSLPLRKTKRFENEILFALLPVKRRSDQNRIQPYNCLSWNVQ